MAFQNLIGQRFGRLTVIERADNDSSGSSMWICKCDCGNITNPVYPSNLKHGRTTSCGCYRQSIGKRTKTHGMRKTRIYSIWTFMKLRCYNKNCKAYKDYGGRGISVCDEWKNDFSAFMKWALNNGYTDKLSIDRINNDKGYCPDNCRWATMKEQQNNRRTNRIIKYCGKTQTLTQWAEEIGVKRNTLLYRLKRGWTIERALSKQ